MSSSSIESDKIYFLLQDRRTVTPLNEYDQLKKVNLSKLVRMIEEVGITSIPDVLTITEEYSEACGTTGVLFQANSENGWFAFCPTGSGFIAMNVPDGTTANGDCRGILAVDWQKLRTSPQQVASGDYSFLGAGQNNLVAGNNSGILSGSNNYIGATASYSGIVAGQNNTITEGSVATFSFIGSGQNNVVMGGLGSVLVGGIENTMTTLGTNASSNYNMIGSGKQNLMEANLMKANIIVGGLRNTISIPFGAYDGEANYNFIGGGRDNRMVTINSTDSGFYGSIILGGLSNILNIEGSSQQDTILGGSLNGIEITGNGYRNSYYNTIVGGNLNSIVSNFSGDHIRGNFVGGGFSNQIVTSSSSVANALVGGASNSITGGSDVNYTVILGGRKNHSNQSINSAIISGSSCKLINEAFSTISGRRNVIQNGTYNFISGGTFNSIYYVRFCSIIGGAANTIRSISATSGGRRNNAIISGASNLMEANTNFRGNIISGGERNTISNPFNTPTSEANYNFIGAGRDNRIRINASDLGAFGSVILGGFSNIIDVNCDTNQDVIIGGSQNGIGLTGIAVYNISHFNTIVGGYQNSIRSNAEFRYNLLSGGFKNQIYYSTDEGGSSLANAIIGGMCNSLRGSIECAGVISGCHNEIYTSNSAIILGGSSNTLESSNFANILGGNDNKLTNSANSSILGGFSNSINMSTTSSIISGRRNRISLNGFNIAFTADNLILGGDCNVIEAEDGLLNNSLIGGKNNTISIPNSTLVSGNSRANYNFIGGGHDNRLITIDSSDNGIYDCVILGGFSNVINCDGYAKQSFIVGGNNNNIGSIGAYYQPNSALQCFILGGSENSILTQKLSDNNSIIGSKNSIITDYYVFSSYGLQNSVIIGGINNSIKKNSYICRNHALVGGNSNRITDGFSSSIIGGGNNSINFSYNSCILGGGYNTISFSNYSIILGGRDNDISSSPNSVACGNDAKISHDHSFVFGGTSSISNSKGRSTSFFNVPNGFFTTPRLLDNDGLFDMKNSLHWDNSTQEVQYMEGDLGQTIAVAGNAFGSRAANPRATVTIPGGILLRAVNGTTVLRLEFWAHSIVLASATAFNITANGTVIASMVASNANDSVRIVCLIYINRAGTTNNTSGFMDHMNSGGSGGITTTTAVNWTASVAVSINANNGTWTIYNLLVQRYLADTTRGIVFT